MVTLPDILLKKNDPTFKYVASIIPVFQFGHSEEEMNSAKCPKCDGEKEAATTVDLKTQISSKDDHTTSANIEPRVKYDYKVGMTDFTVWGRLGLGEKVQSSGNFGYYTVEPGISYAVLPNAKLFVSDRYRDSFSDGKNYQTNTVYFGGNYDVTSFDTVSAKVYRKYNDTESNGVEFAYTRWF